MKKKIIWGIIAIIVVLTLIGVYQPNQEEGEIKIGVLALLSGEGAAWGENAQMGINLAVKEINENGGINGKTIEIVYEDTQGEAKNAVSSFRKLIDLEKVDAVIGPLFQQEVAAIAPIADELGIPVVTPSYAPIENRPNPRNPLMIWMDPTEEAGRMAEFVFESNIRKIASIGTQDSWESEVTKAFNNHFMSLGGEVVFSDLLQVDSTDTRTVLLKAIQNNPEALYFGTYYQFVKLVRQSKELAFSGPLYGIEVDNYLVGETNPFSNNLQFIAPESYGTDFVDKFESEYQQKPGIPTGQAYDATYILANFFDGSNNSKDVLDRMEKFESYQGASGTIEINKDQKTILPTAIFEINNGEIVKLN